LSGSSVPAVPSGASVPSAPSVLSGSSAPSAFSGSSAPSASSVPSGPSVPELLSSVTSSTEQHSSDASALSCPPLPAVGLVVEEAGSSFLSPDDDSLSSALGPLASAFDTSSSAFGSLPSDADWLSCDAESSSLPATSPAASEGAVASSSPCSGSVTSTLTVFALGASPSVLSSFSTASFEAVAASVLD